MKHHKDLNHRNANAFIANELSFHSNFRSRFHDNRINLHNLWCHIIWPLKTVSKLPTAHQVATANRVSVSTKLSRQPCFLLIKYSQH